MILPDLSPFEADPAALPVLAEIRRERWRKARDAAKDLCRREKARYLPLLVAANAGLAKDLLDRGLTQDAAPVLEYLKTIAPPELLASLQATQAESAATTALKKATGGNPQEAASWQVAESAAQALELGQEATPEAVRAADRLVTAGWTLPEATSPFAVELRAVRAAVQATGDGLWEVAREALQALPRRSLFQHWRFFLRGVRHAHLGEKAEAQRCFDALPAGSAPARAAALYRDLLDLPATVDKAPAEASIPLLAALAAVPAAWAAPLTEAQRHWERGKLDKAYEALANPLRHHFPTEVPGLGSILTDVLMASCAGKSSLPHAAQQDLASLLYRRHDEKHFRSDREALFAIRFLLHEDGPSLDPRDLEEFGAKLALIWARTSQPDPIRESAIWSFIAGLLQSPTADGKLSGVPPDQVAILRRLYKKAAELDPENPAPAVRLALFFLSTGDSSAYNAQLTDLVKRFPEQKTVLLLSAEESIRRQSWPKALKTLRQAMTSDPADRVIRDRIVQVLQEQAMALVRKGQPVPDSLWQEIGPLLLDLPAHPSEVPAGFSFRRSRWAVRTLQQLIGGPRPAEESAPPAPAPWAHEFMIRLLMQRFGVAQARAVPTDPATWQDLLWIAHLIEWDDAERERKNHENTALVQLIAQLVGQLKAQGRLMDDPAGMLAVADRLQEGQNGDDPFMPCLWRSASHALGSVIGPLARKKKSAYPLRLASIINPDRGKLPARLVSELTAILKEATAAGDAPAMELAANYLKRAEEMQAERFPWDDLSAPETDGPDDDDEAPWATPPAGDEPDHAQTILLLAAVTKLLPKSSIEQLRRTMESQGVDRQAWQALVQLAKTAGAKMTNKEAQSLLESAPTSPGDPTFFQPDLFQP